MSPAWVTERDAPNYNQTVAGDLELVDAETGDVQQSVTRPSGSRLVDVIGDNAVVYNDFHDPGSVAVVSPSGKTTILEPPRDGIVRSRHRHGRSGRRRQGHTQRQHSRRVGETILVVADDGDTTSIPVPATAGGRWAWLGSQTLETRMESCHERSPGKPTTRRYSEAEKERAVRMVRQLRKELGTDHGTISRVANQLGYRRRVGAHLGPRPRSTTG